MSSTTQLHKVKEAATTLETALIHLNRKQHSIKKANLPSAIL